MDEFEIQSTIGEGTYGIVYKCKHKITGVTVAIKRFRDMNHQDQETLKHLQNITAREIKLLSRIRHDNIIRLLDVFKVRDQAHLVFEFIDHNLLDEIQINPGGIEEHRTKGYIWQICKAVCFLHQRSIAHRDLKPENILISNTGIVKLCDFGFARFMRDSELKTDYIATRWYRAPELLITAGDYGKGVDIWSLGCVLSECLTSRPLFPGESDLDQLYQILKTVSCKQRLSLIFPFSKNVMHLERSIKHLESKSFAKFNTLPMLKPEIMVFLKKCLVIDPRQRSSIEEIMALPYFLNGRWNVNFDRQIQTLTALKFGNYEAYKLYSVSKRSPNSMTRNHMINSSLERKGLLSHITSQFQSVSFLERRKSLESSNSLITKDSLSKSNTMKRPLIKNVSLLPPLRKEN